MDPQFSKDVCAICLESATAGQGKSVFISDCSHTFHFECIATSVSHANRTCPNCRSTWVHLPSLAPNPNNIPVNRPNNSTHPNDSSDTSDSDSDDTSDSDSSSLALIPNNNPVNRPNNSVYPLSTQSYYSSTPILSSPSPISARTSTRGGAPPADRTPLIKKVVSKGNINKPHNKWSCLRRAERERMRDSDRFLTLTRPVDPRRDRSRR